MKILVTNDDGILAPGINVLAAALEDIGEVTVVAPDRNHSGASSALTLSHPIRAHKTEANRYAIEGTPTDCVHLAITGLLPEQPDIVVSGINAGTNLGDDVFYSGTVAAAMEGRFMGLPAIALSLEAGGPEEGHYECAAQVAKQMVENLVGRTLAKNTILNINVPDLPHDQLRGFDVTRLGTRHCAEPMIEQVDPRGNTVYWIGRPGPEEDAGPGTDFYALKDGKVSITPIHLDMTNYQCFDDVTKWTSTL